MKKIPVEEFIIQMNTKEAIKCWEEYREVFERNNCIVMKIGENFIQVLAACNIIDKDQHLAGYEIKY